jgi:hypothetical protein
MQSGLERMNSNSTINLEQKLANMLKPVRPDPVFLNTLKTRLSQSPTILLETSKKQIGLMVFGAGLFVGALVFWIIGKGKKGKG